MTIQLTLRRSKFFTTHTLGQLYIEGEFFCFTLEDVVREVSGEPVERWKVQSETAIPYGTYKVTFEDSKKFGPQTLTLNDVPGFTNIRIHSGNTAADTEGCLIVGYKLFNDIIAPGSTRPALRDLKQRLTGMSNIILTIDKL